MNDDRMKGLIGYHISGEYEPENGLAYDYILAGNGIFIEACGAHITARIPIAEAKTRGLPMMRTVIEMEHGRVPQRFWDLALSYFLASPEVERYVGIIWKGGYQLYIPEQTCSGGKVEYHVGKNVVVEMHSHAKDIGPYFSAVDDADDQGLKIYGVVGDLYGEKPAVNLRLGVYGYFHPVRWEEVFEGSLQGVDDVVALEEKERIA